MTGSIHFPYILPDPIVLLCTHMQWVFLVHHAMLRNFVRSQHRRFGQFNLQL